VRLYRSATVPTNAAVTSVLIPNLTAILAGCLPRRTRGILRQPVRQQPDRPLPKLRRILLRHIPILSKTGRNKTQDASPRGRPAPMEARTTPPGSHPPTPLPGSARYYRRGTIASHTLQDPTSHEHPHLPQPQEHNNARPTALKQSRDPIALHARFSWACTAQPEKFHRRSRRQAAANSAGSKRGSKQRERLLHYRTNDGNQQQKEGHR